MEVALYWNWRWANSKILAFRCEFTHLVYSLRMRVCDGKDISHIFYIYTLLQLVYS